VPVAAGVTAALVRDRLGAGPGRRRAAEDSAAVALAVASAVAVLGWLASGPVGPGRMADTGPTWWLVGAVTAAEIAVVTAATSGLLPVLRRER
jgi:hypothetical protein